MRPWQYLSIFSWITVIIGCGESDSGPPLAPVTGKIIWKGEPLPGCAVKFVPADGTVGWGGHAMTNDAGEYKLLEAKTARLGVQPGSYRVVLSRRLMPDGSRVPAGDRTAPIESPAIESLPPAYSDLQNSILMVTIPAEGGVFDFSLPNKS